MNSYIYPRFIVSKTCNFIWWKNARFQKTTCFKGVHWHENRCPYFQNETILSTSYSSHICYRILFCNDLFLNHNTIALVHNCLRNYSAVWSLKLLWMKKKNQLLKYHSASSCSTVLHAMIVHKHSDSSFCFCVFEKGLTQENCFLFCKSMVCLTVSFS